MRRPLQFWNTVPVDAKGGEKKVDPKERKKKAEPAADLKIVDEKAFKQGTMDVKVFLDKSELVCCWSEGTHFVM